MKSKKQGKLGLMLCGLLVLLALAGCKQALERTPLATPAFDAETLEHLRQTHPLNIGQILAQKTLQAPSGAMVLQNPYVPVTPLSLLACGQDANCSYSLLRTGLPRLSFPAQPQVYDWWRQRNGEPDQAQVCGVQFADTAGEDYRLATFPNRDELVASGFELTHFQACGACSTLQDLAVYGELDLTVMAKVCSKRWSLAEKKSCMQAIGFSEACAESWAYNAMKTAQSCALVCIREYGLMALLTGTENVPPVNEQGELNACLLCDEMMSGPGFQYSAGRTRRNSGIISEIDRPDEEVYEVLHRYFE
ncbi:MAG: hypothetical protein HPY82_18930 [Gammaproteobacteria bacterium]|nr:hypothetical protein [Gammaproteobacteria bacterium]